MFESLRQSKSLLCFMDPARGYGQVIADPLCESGILKCFLDDPMEYRIILLDVIEKTPGKNPGRGLALRKLPSDELMATSRERTTKVMEEFERNTAQAVESKRLWPHLNFLEKVDGEQEEESLAALVGNDTVSEYICKVNESVSELKHFSICPITYHGLYDLKPDQVMALLSEDTKKSEAARQNMSCLDLKYRTNVPSLVEELRCVLKDGSVQVKEILAKQLKGYCDQLNHLVVLASDEDSWVGFGDAVKDKLSQIKHNVKAVNEMKRINSSYTYSSTGDVANSLQCLFVELKAEQTKFCEALSASTLQAVQAGAEPRFQKFVKTLKKSSRDLVNVVTVDCDERAVLPLLHLLFKNLLDFEVFSVQWRKHNDSLQEIAGVHLDRLKEMMTESYNVFFSKTDKSELFRKFVESRVKMTINSVTASVMKKLADYRRIYYNRQKGGLWGMRPTLFAISQEILFSHLSKKDKKDPKQVEKAIRDKMVLAAQEGVLAIFVQPSELLASLRYGNGKDEQGDECMRLRGLCHVMFERSIKQLSTCKAGGGEWADVKDRFGLVNSKLSDIRSRLEVTDEHVAVAKYEPTRPSRIDQDVDDESNFEVTDGRLEPFDLQKISKACDVKEPRVYCPNYPSSNTCLAGIDRRGLYRSLAVAM